MENFGQYLRKLRLEQKLTLRGVQEMAGVSNSYLTLNNSSSKSFGER